MQERKRGGDLLGAAAILLLLVLTGGWFFWGRDFQDRRQVRLLLREAIEACQGGRKGEARELEYRAHEIRDLPTLTGAEKELWVRLCVMMLDHERIENPPRSD